MGTPSFRWGILGTGFAARKFVLGLRAAPGARAVAVASRSRERAVEFARRFGVTHAHDGYAALAADGKVDAVYVATPPVLHSEHASLCVAAGKPVLVEKPFTTTAREARELVAAARARSVFCMEAMWTRFLPLVVRLKRLLEARELGEPHLLWGSFGIAERPDRGRALFDPALGGGALLDRGVYPLSLAVHLLGPVRELRAQAALGETGVDEDVALTLQHAAGGLSLLQASLRVDCANELSVCGTRGRVVVHAPIYRPSRMTVWPSAPREAARPAPPGREAFAESGLVHGAFQRFHALAEALRSRGARRHVERYAGNGYQHQAEEVMRCVREGRVESPVMPHADSVEVMRLVDAARSEWRGRQGDAA